MLFIGVLKIIVELKGIKENNQKEWFFEIFKDYNNGEWNNNQ